ncbi:MAG: hypothetical protein IPJ65_13610 [Archangiaceae bacterium]|nr:hypothetical protein [Archangiaceae bacterium]
MNPVDALKSRVEYREKLRELVRRLVDDAKHRPELRRPPMVKSLERAIAGLDDLIGALAEDPTEGGTSTGWAACPICDSDPDRCISGGQCALEPDRKRRPEPWDAKTLFLPRSCMQTIKEAIDRVSEVADPQWITDSAALYFAAIDFVATHTWTRRSPHQSLKIIVETLEASMRLFIMVFDRSGKLLYGFERLPRLIEAVEDASAAISALDAPRPRARRRSATK